MLRDYGIGNSRGSSFCNTRQGILWVVGSSSVEQGSQMPVENWAQAPTGREAYTVACNLESLYIITSQAEALRLFLLGQRKLQVDYGKDNSSEEIHLRGIGKDGLKVICFFSCIEFTAMLLSRVEFCIIYSLIIFSSVSDSKQLTTHALHSISCSLSLIILFLIHTPTFTEHLWLEVGGSF